MLRHLTTTTTTTAVVVEAADAGLARAVVQARGGEVGQLAAAEAEAAAWQGGVAAMVYAAACDVDSLCEAAVHVCLYKCPIWHPPGADAAAAERRVARGAHARAAPATALRGHVAGAGGARGVGSGHSLDTCV